MSFNQNAVGVKNLMYYRYRQVSIEKDDLELKISRLSEEVTRLTSEIPKQFSDWSTKQLEDEANYLSLTIDTSRNSAKKRAILQRIETLTRARKAKKTIEEKQDKLRKLNESLSYRLYSIQKLTSFLLDEMGLVSRHYCETATEPIKVTIDYDPRMTGLVIGKDGANIKEIQGHGPVEIYLDDTNGLITLRGTQDAIYRSAKKLFGFVKAKEEVVDVSTSLKRYLCHYCRRLRLNGPPEFCSQHPYVQIALKDSDQVCLRGMEEDIVNARDVLLRLNVVHKFSSLTNNQVSTILGSRGKNIQALESAYRDIIFKVNRKEKKSRSFSLVPSATSKPQCLLLKSYCSSPIPASARFESRESYARFSTVTNEQDSRSSKRT